jgi:hypothetical protein
MNRSQPAGVVALATSLALCGASACKDNGPKPPDGPPADSAMAASGPGADSLSTNIGSAIAIEAHLAATSAKWDQFVVVNDKTVVLTGRAYNKAVALKTTTGGRSWSGFSQTRPGWSAWGVGSDGSVALLGGTVKKGSARAASIENLSVWLGAPDAKALRGPMSLPEGKPILVARMAQPAVLSQTTASLLLQTPRDQILTTGDSSVLSKRLPRGDWIAKPYGLPPQLVNIEAGQLKVRPWPAAGQAPDQALSMPNFRAGAATTRSMRSGPRCSHAGLTFQRVSNASTQPYAVGISQQRLIAVALPKKSGKVFGCGPGSVVVDIDDTAAKKLLLIQCPFKAACAKPKNQPFDLWPEEHKRDIRAVTTEQGVVAVMQATAGSRWGLYLGHSLDQGKTFELAREIGTGNGSDGYRLGALLAIGKRVLLFFTAETPNPNNATRSWYVMASDDAGATWGPP